MRPPQQYELINSSESVASTVFDDVDFTPIKDSHSPISTASSTFSFYSLTHAEDMFDSSALDDTCLTRREACEFVVQWYVAEMDSEFKPRINGQLIESSRIIEEILKDEVLSKNLIYHN